MSDREYVGVEIQAINAQFPLPVIFVRFVRTQPRL